MALSLPSAANVVGSFVTTTNTANLTPLIVGAGRHSNLQSSVGNNDFQGHGMRMSANGDYAIIANRANTGNGCTGRPIIYKKTGDVWTIDTTFIPSYMFRMGANDRYGDFAEVQKKGVDIDEAGETAIVGCSAGTTDGAIDVWTRSGASWSHNAFLDDGGQRLGEHGVAISGDGNTIIASCGNDQRLAMWTKSGSSWSQQSDLYTGTNGGSGIGPGGYAVGIGSISINNDGTRIACLDLQRNDNDFNIGKRARLQTFYYDGSAWQSHLQIIDQTGHSSAESQAYHIEISNDGIYVIVSFRDGTVDFTGRFHVFKWNGSNAYVEESVIDNATAGGATTNNGMYIGRHFRLNYDGSVLVAIGNTNGSQGNPNHNGRTQTQQAWYIYERTGSTWTFKAKHTHVNGLNSIGDIELSSDGKHILVSAPNARYSSTGYGLAGGLGNEINQGSVEYFKPTGEIASSLADGDIHTHQGRKFKYNAAKGRWRPAKASDLDGISSSRKRSRGVQNAQLESDLDLNIDGVTVSIDAFAGRTETYANASIFPFSSLQSGDQAIALDTGYLYVTDGSGWFKVANSQLV